jgi:clorobiocin biosynthesis protein CloN6
METVKPSSYSMCRLQADMLFIHAPAYFEFRKETKVYFPYLSTSGDVPVTPLYEYYPRGFNTLRRFLTEKGYTVDIINLSSVLLKYPELDIVQLLKELDVKVIGIDLHWMVHVQGSLEIAALLKRLHCQTIIVFGGISSSFYADELIRYPFIDMVMRGYDTHIPMAQLMDAVTSGRDFNAIPNLLWKDRSGQVRDNPLSHMPSTFSLGMDWSNIPEPARGELFPIAELLSAQTTGCTNHCLWCGGSRESFKKLYRTRHTVSKKDLAEISYEFETMKTLPNLEKYHYYTCSSYNEPDRRLEFLIDLIAQSRLKSVNYEQFYLTKDIMLKKMAKANSKTVITLSPESHDIEISRLSGRGTYTMDEMENWISRALDYGIHEIDIWFFIGMPRQDRDSVHDTLRYCEKLLKKFQGKNVVPLFCPLVPFLDPGSTFFLEPEQHGYKLFFHTIEEHRKGMKRASFINRINYETQWLCREDLVYVGYEAVRELFLMKGAVGMMPDSIVRSAVDKINDAEKFLKLVHRIDCLEDPTEREIELEKISGEIRKRNKAIFFSGVANQVFPVNRKIGGRWFDAIPWDRTILEQLEGRGR